MNQKRAMNKNNNPKMSPDAMHCVVSNLPRLLGTRGSLGSRPWGSLSPFKLNHIVGTVEHTRKLKFDLLHCHLPVPPLQQCYLSDSLSKRNSLFYHDFHLFVAVLYFRCFVFSLFCYSKFCIQSPRPLISLI